MSYAAGLRRDELAHLGIENIVEDDGETVTVKVTTAKRNKERMVYLDNGSMLALRDWLAVRGDDPGALFWSGRRGGHLIRLPLPGPVCTAGRQQTGGQRMTGQAIRNVVAARQNVGAIRRIGSTGERGCRRSRRLPAGPPDPACRQAWRRVGKAGGR